MVSMSTGIAWIMILIITQITAAGRGIQAQARVIQTVDYPTRL